MTDVGLTPATVPDSILGAILGIADEEAAAE